MQVYHPPQAYNGLAPENVFFVADNANTTVAQGYLVQTYHPYLFPERPINLYLNLASKGPGLDMLMGALLARAVQLRQQTPNLKARVFAQVGMQDASMLSFYQESGFLPDDALDVVRITAPSAKPMAPMGYELGQVPLSQVLEQTAFLMRMNTYRLDVLQQPMLQRYMAMPHFTALYLSRGPEIVGEIAFTGTGDTAHLIGLYVMRNYRQLGLAKTLISAGMRMLNEHGVANVEADVIRRNLAQCRLAQSCGATFVRTACLYPGINYD
ncbi:MAG: GNAT family N-acetyltransferase [Candidatus Limiplasma sp.]|nr:GNAT family N-acetyltransferase [Candidatus Limiplasma sp.]